MAAPVAVVAGPTTLEVVGTDDTVRCRVGGAGHLVAVALHRLGWQVRLATAVGDDPLGDAVLADLRGRGLDPGWVTRPLERTGARLVLVGEDGGRGVVDDADDAAAASYPPALVDAALDGADVVVLTPGGVAASLHPGVLERRLPVAAGVLPVGPGGAVDPLAGTADVVVVGPVPPADADAAVAAVRAVADPEVLAVALGGSGCALHVRRADPVVLAPALPADGRPERRAAGTAQALLAGLLDGLHRGGEPAGAARRGVLLASALAASRGGADALLDRDALDALEERVLARVAAAGGAR